MEAFGVYSYIVLRSDILGYYLQGIALAEPFKIPAGLRGIHEMDGPELPFGDPAEYLLDPDQDMGVCRQGPPAVLQFDCSVNFCH